MLVRHDHRVVRGPAGRGHPVHLRRHRHQTTDAGQTNAFTVFNQLATTTTSGVPTTFGYADTDNTERTTANNTSFVTGILGQTAETTPTGTISYIRDPSGTLIAERAGATSYYVTPDAQGSTIAVTGDTNSATLAAAYTYDPWGNTTTQTGGQANTIKYRYATGYYDTTTSLYKLGARYYNPTTGRFTQPDPSGQETKAYAYTGDNPVNAIDPSGLYEADCGYVSCTLRLNYQETNDLALAGGEIGAAVFFQSLALEPPFDALGATAGGLLLFAAGAAAGAYLQGKCVTFKAGLTVENGLTAQYDNC